MHSADFVRESVASWLLTLLAPAGMAASALLAETVYSIGANVIIDSAVRAITAWDIITSLMKSWVFGVIISVVSPCGSHAAQSRSNA